MVALGANLAKRHITNVKVVIMTTTDLRAAKYSPQKFVDWLLACDIHFILSHVHQSLNFWDCREIAPQYARLIGHRGFPTGQQHFCCIFLQDKIIYLHALRDYCNPTVQIHIPWCERSKEVDILSMSIIPLETGGLFVVKTPFTTNCDHFKIVHSLQEVIGLSILICCARPIHLFIVLVIYLFIIPPPSPSPLPSPPLPSFPLLRPSHPLPCPGNRTSAVYIRHLFAPTPLRDDSSLHGKQERSQSCMPQW